MLTEDNYSTLLGTTTIPSVMRELNVSTLNEAAQFYDSEIYALLSEQETGLWHLSPVTIAELYREELTGALPQMPEEQS